MKSVGQAVKEVRKKKNITQEKLAKETGMSAISISSIERGLANPTIGILNDIAKGLNTSVLAFFIFSFNREDATNKDAYDFTMPSVKELILAII